MSCLILFLIGDVVAELLASAIIYFKKVFPVQLERCFDSFFRSGYVGGLILGIGIWIKILLKARKGQKTPSE